MQLSPRYGSDPVISLDGSPAAIAAPAIRQRNRLAGTIAAFTERQWAQPSRCEGWTTREVVAHLDTTNTFWTHSIAAGLRGEPTQFLATFDPVTTPAKLVERSRDVPIAELLDQFLSSTESMVDLLGSLDEADWSRPAEAPPGHVSISAVVHHALWDSWVHERDILIPMGITPRHEDDEVAATLRYAAGLAPAFGVNRGSVDAGTLGIDVTNPDLSFVVIVGDGVVVRSNSPVHSNTAAADLHLVGDAVELLEALSLRRPLNHAVPSDFAWMVHGLAETFDAAAGTLGTEKSSGP